MRRSMQWEAPSMPTAAYDIRDDVKPAQLVRAREYQSRSRQFDSSKTPKTPRTQIYMDLSYIDPQTMVQNNCAKQ